jgi:hypothetical protein
MLPEQLSASAGEGSIKGFAGRARLGSGRSLRGTAVGLPTACVGEPRPQRTLRLRIARRESRFSWEEKGFASTRDLAAAHSVSKSIGSAP